MLTTTAGGRVWNFSHAIGRNAAAGAGFTQPMAVAAATGGVLYVVSRGQERSGGVIMENKRLSKVTIDEEFIGEFGRTEFAWPAAIAVASDGSVYCADEVEKPHRDVQLRRRASGDSGASPALKRDCWMDLAGWPSTATTTCMSSSAATIACRDSPRTASSRPRGAARAAARASSTTPGESPST